MTTLLRFEVTKTLKIEDSILQNWLTLIEANYHSDNSYHNSSHAADVLQVDDTNNNNKDNNQTIMKGNSILLGEGANNFILG